MRRNSSVLKGSRLKSRDGAITLKPKCYEPTVEVFLFDERRCVDTLARWIFFFRGVRHESTSVLSDHTLNKTSHAVPFQPTHAVCSLSKNHSYISCCP